MSDTMFRIAEFFQKSYHRGEIEGSLKTARSTYEGIGGPANFGAAQAHAQGFHVIRGDYNFVQVDAVMGRLESAFVARTRADHVAVNDQEAWVNLVLEQATALYPRSLRPAGKRFSHLKGQECGYRSTDVDALLERLAACFNENEPLTNREVHDAVFVESEGTHTYTEGSVDAYLTRAVEVLLAVE